jgi:jumonji domain-containing protein 7
VSWISLDPEDPDAHQKHPRFKLASPLRITVRAGETLYLPAMWLHRVSQTCLTISVNYWYDMRFDLRFCFYNVIQKLNDMAISDMDRSSAIKDEEER